MKLVASALLTLGLIGCNRSSSPSYAPATAESNETSAYPMPSAADETMAPEEKMAPQEPTSSQENTMGGIAQTSCPIAAEPESITSVDVPNGAALVFRTNDPAEKSELREQLDSIAKQQGTTASAAPSAPPSDEENGLRQIPTTPAPAASAVPAGQEPASAWVASATEARAEETTQGVQLVFTTDSDVQGLRNEVRERADALNTSCSATPATPSSAATPAPQQR